MIGVVHYKIKSNFDVLLHAGIIGLGCHPDVEAVKDQVESNFPDLDNSVVDKYPEVGGLGDQYAKLNNSLNICMDELKKDIDSVINKDPPYNDEINSITRCENNLVNKFTDFASNMKNLLNSILAKADNPINSTLDVDKTVVRANGLDKATLMVMPRDATGSLLAKNLPSGVDISVEFFTGFGTISNKRRNNITGQVLADITSPTIGKAIVTAKINGNFIIDISTGVRVTKTLSVNFVSDAALPTRRTVE